MKTYNSLQELFNDFDFKNNQLNAQQVINKRAFINGDYQNFELSTEASLELVDMILDILGGRSQTKSNMKSTLLYSTPQHWGLGRLLFAKYGDSPVRLSYCAGQDYPGELSTIRKFLSK